MLMLDMRHADAPLMPPLPPPCRYACFQHELLRVSMLHSVYEPAISELRCRLMPPPPRRRRRCRRLFDYAAIAAMPPI